jgi:hypothetical protein
MTKGFIQEAQEQLDIVDETILDFASIQSCKLEKDNEPIQKLLKLVFNSRKNIHLILGHADIHIYPYFLSNPPLEFSFTNVYP